jgi:dihydroneopterin aldolase
VTDSVFVRGIAAEGRHGLAGERDVPQLFIADVEVSLNIAAVASLDRLDATVDYVWIERITRRVIEENSFELLETLTHTIASEVLALGGETVRVTVSKPQAAETIGVKEITVVVERSRD